jgi:type IX secretion system PorP/SprF family membrane protein
MKTIYTTFTLVLLSFAAQAQQMPIYNGYYLNSELYNPSAVGIGNTIKLSTIHKQYLTGFSGNPQTTFLSASAPLKDDKIGVGLNFYNDRQGVLNRTNIQGAYAYKIQLGNAHSLAFGASMGLMQVSVDPNLMTLDDPNDQLLVNKTFSKSILDGNFGLTYSLKGVKLEFAVNHALGLKGRFSESVSYQPLRNYIATASYQFFLSSSRNFSITPIIFTRFSEIDLPQEAALVFNYKDLVQIAPGYKDNGAFSATASFCLFNKLTVGYSYETGANNDGVAFQTGAHEVILAYRFKSATSGLVEQQKQINDLNTMLDEYQEAQRQRDALQDSSINNQNKKIEENTKGLEETKEGLEEQKKEIIQIDSNLRQTQQELANLRKELIKSGVLREGNAVDFSAEKGYYIVLASVNKRNYNETAMQKEYLSKGYKKIFSEKTGWHYVYKVTADNFADAMSELKKARANEEPKAWIFILE